MAIEHRMVHFRTDDFSEVIAELDGIADRANSKEWVTFSPWVDPEHLPVVSMLQRIFSGRGSKVPEVTWVPAQDGEPAQLGILHANGANAADYLAQSNLEPPKGWIKVSDHSKRGLLYAIHPDTKNRATVEFVVEVAAVLSHVPTDDRWIAQVSTSPDT